MASTNSSNLGVKYAQAAYFVTEPISVEIYKTGNVLVARQLILNQPVMSAFGSAPQKVKLSLLQNEHSFAVSAGTTLTKVRVITVSNIDGGLYVEKDININFTVNGIFKISLAELIYD